MPRAQAPAQVAAVAPAAATANTAAAGIAIPGLVIPPGVPPPRMGFSSADKLVQTGLADKFNGRVVSVWALPRKYKTGKKQGTYQLFGAINIQADDTTLGHDGLVTEYYKISGLNQWVPSRMEPQWNGSAWVYTPTGTALPGISIWDTYLKLHTGDTGWPDAKNPTETAMVAPEDWWGWFTVPGPHNSTDNLPKGTKWSQFLDELKRVDYEKKAPHINVYDFRQFLVGVYAHWVRIPYVFSGGTAPDDAQKFDTLCLSDILDLGPISGVKGGSMVAVPGAPTPVAQATPAQQTSAAPAAAASVPAPAAAGPGSGAPLPSSRTDPRAISDAANQILTQLAVTRTMPDGTRGLTKQDAGAPVFEGVNAMKLDGATALRFLNDNEWMVADERGFGYVLEKGWIVPL